MAFKIEIISREAIKPSHPTPEHLRIYKLSFIDQFAPAVYTPLLLFYPANDVVDKSQLLKKSLSETLTHFYPLAGRVKDNSIIKCNDDGAVYLEAQVNCHLTLILENPVADSLKRLHPVNNNNQEEDCPVLLIQASFFACKGLAIGIAVSHKVGDSSTVTTFLKAWSAIALGCITQAMKPEYVLSALYPPVEFPIKLPPVQQLKKSKSTIRRYVFNASKIAELKAKVASATVPWPTRVEAVLALLWKCAMAASRSKLGACRPSAMTQMVNIRKRVVPPLPENSFGNFLGHFTAHEEGVRKTNLQHLVVQLRSGLDEYYENHIKKLQEDAHLALGEAGKEIVNLLTNEDIDHYTCTSWCRSNIYDIDFGWGRPKWVFSFYEAAIDNSFMFLDTNDGEGVEAWLTLSEEDIPFLENNKELLSFVSVNPVILISSTRTKILSSRL